MYIYFIFHFHTIVSNLQLRGEKVFRQKVRREELQNGRPHLSCGVSWAPSNLAYMCLYLSNYPDI